MTEQLLGQVAQGEKTFEGVDGCFVCGAGAGVLPAVSDRLLSKLKGNGDNLVDAVIGRPDR